MPPSICVFRDLFAIQDRSAVPGLMNLEEKLLAAAFCDVRLIFVCNRFAILLTIYFPTFCCCRVTGDVMPIAISSYVVKTLPAHQRSREL